MSSYYYGGWAPYISVAQRREKALKKLKALEKKGRVCQPVVVEGRTIARTFWGKKWCDNLESYSDYTSRLERGRSYVRNGSVIDLQITTGKITALVAGSEVYDVRIDVSALEATLWQSILNECAGKVASLVELLQGKLSNAVMEVVTRAGTGLFPVPKQIHFRCSCPDSAYMCKHVAATLYGVGSRFDSQPQLLFQLCHVDPLELIQQAGTMPVADAKTVLGEHQQLDTSDLSSLFGIELNDPSFDSKAAEPAKVSNAPVQSEPAKKKSAARHKRTKTVTASELIARGIPRYMHQSWLGSGILQRTEKRGVYLTSQQTEERIVSYLDQRRVIARQALADNSEFN